VAVFGLLTVFGLVMVLSASSVRAFVAEENSYDVFVRQLVFCVPGLFLFWLGLRLTPRQLRALAPASLVLGIASLVAVLAFGTEVGGSQAWIRIAGVSVQPSEAVKVALTFWGAHVLVARRAVMHRWKYALSPVVPVAGLICVLLVLQPDLGMTITMGTVVIALLFFAGAPARLMAALLAGAAGGALVLGLTAPYRLARITSFLDGGSDYQEAGFQARQALYALADGGLFGTGLGSGRSKWNYLPNAHNDFIFAIIGEELGFVGALRRAGAVRHAGLHRLPHRRPQRRPVAAARGRGVHHVARGPGGDQHRVRGGPAARDRAAAAADLLGRHLPDRDHVRVRGAGQRRAARARRDRRAPRRPPPRSGFAALVLPPVPEPYRAPVRRPPGRVR
jgi:hypothetical protein